MVVQLEKRRWKTEPFRCWAKFKEGTSTSYREDGLADEKGELVCRSGGGGGWMGLMARNVGGHAYCSMVAGAGLAAEYCEATEARGYGRNICSYARVDLGSMFLDKYAFGTTMPKADFIIGGGGACDAGRCQMPPQADYEKVPLRWCENPQIYEFDSEQTKKNKMEFAVAQTLETIEWVEQRTGKKLDDEAYIKQLYLTSRSTNLASQIIIMNQNIPAPIDEKSMYSLLVARGGGRGRGGDTDEEGINLMRELRDEVEYRVRNQIAAVGTERYRVMTYGLPPWHSLKIFRYMEQYGVVSIGSRYAFNNGGSTCLTAGGLEVPIPTLQEQGIVLRTREDAVRASLQQQRLIDRPGWQHRFGGRWERENQLRMARLWHCDGLVMHHNLGCRGVTLWAPQVRLAFLENNIPVVTYQGAHCDPRDWDEARVYARIDAFMESQGLEKLV